MQDFFGRVSILKQANEHIRRAARVANVPLYAVANSIGVSEATLWRWLRVPLTGDKERRIMAASATLEREAGRWTS